MVTYLSMETDTVQAMMTCMPIMTTRDTMDMKTWATQCLVVNLETDHKDLVNFKDTSHIKFKVAQLDLSLPQAHFIRCLFLFNLVLLSMLILPDFLYMKNTNTTLKYLRIEAFVLFTKK